MQASEHAGRPVIKYANMDPGSHTARQALWQQGSSHIIIYFKIYPGRRESIAALPSKSNPEPIPKSTPDSIHPALDRNKNASKQARQPASQPASQQASERISERGPSERTNERGASSQRINHQIANEPATEQVCERSRASERASEQASERARASKIGPAGPKLVQKSVTHFGPIFGDALFFVLFNKETKRDPKIGAVF